MHTNLLYALIISALLAVPPAFAKPGNLASDQTFHRSNGAEVQTLDPHKAEGVPASNILRDLYEGLTIEAPNGDIIPGAAGSWDISDDNKVYTFHLRKNAKWSNGDPVTAHDFVFGLRRSADPATGSKYSQILYPIENAEQVVAGNMPPEKLAVKAIDDYTLEIRLIAPTPYFLGLLNHSTTYPVYAASVEKHGDRFSRPGKLVGNGAYTLKEWDPQSHIQLIRNSNYWDNANTTINVVYFYPIENEHSEQLRYRAGDIDYTSTIPGKKKQVEWIKKNLPGELHIGPYLGTYYYGFNLTRPPFKDNLKLRKALSMAIDRDIITEKVTGLGEIPSYSWVPAGIINYTSQKLDFAGLSKQDRLKQAKKLYQEAGYSKSNPLVVEIRYNTSEGHKKVALAISAMWKTNLGVQTRLVNEEWKVFLENRKQKRLTQVFRGGWIGDYNDANTFAELMHSTHGINDSGYDNPEYDQLLAEASVEGDLEKRREMLQHAERILLNDNAIIPLYNYVTKHMIKPWVGGYVPNILDHTYTKDLWIERH